MYNLIPNWENDSGYCTLFRSGGPFVKFINVDNRIRIKDYYIQGILFCVCLLNKIF